MAGVCDRCPTRPFRQVRPQAEEGAAAGAAAAPRALLRAGAYVLPSGVDDAVVTVFGLHGLPAPRLRFEDGQY